MEQNLIIKIKDIGNLIITAYTNQKFEDFKINNLQFNNIPIVEEIDNITPIQYKNKVYFLEETEYQVIFDSKISNFEVLPEMKLFKKASQFVGLLNFKSYVGKSYIAIKKDNECIFKLPVEVRSKKLDYENDYRTMVGDLSFNIFKSSSPTFEYLKLDEYSDEYYMLLEWLFKEENLPSTFEYLSRNLNKKLIQVKETVPKVLARQISFDFSFDDNITQVIQLDSIDTVENRFFKYFLEFVRSLIARLDKYPNLDLFEDKINYYLSKRFFNDISKMNYLPLNSQVLQKKEGYREILEYYLLLQNGLEITYDLDLFKGYEKKLHKIYEYWCYFKLVKLLGGDFKDISFKEGSAIKINDEITLYYNKTFKKGSYSVEMRPDYTIEINDYYIHLDAKYKLDINPDILKMHSYKDGILNSKAAFVLYPGNNQFIYKKNNKETIGAFPFRPNNEITIKNCYMCMVKLIDYF